MSTDLDLGCRCGAVTGVARGLTPRRGNRLVCYCDDCQAFAHFLGGSEAWLDEHGGTPIFQTSQGRIEILQGREHLAAVRLGPRGLVRWHTACCRTPIGNTLATRQVPFLGLIEGFVDPDADLDAHLGPIRGRIQTRFATRDLTDQLGASLLLRSAWVPIAARLKGDHNRSPFFDRATGDLSVPPRILTPEERSAITPRA